MQKFLFEKLKIITTFAILDLINNGSLLLLPI